MMTTAMNVMMISVCFGAPPQQPSTLQANAPLPPFATVQEIVERTLLDTRDRSPRDLVSRSQVEAILAAIKQQGWDVADRKEIVEKVLPDQHILVTTFRTPAGRKFMKAIAGRELMYDRLDRIAEVPGGRQLIIDIVKLPDGERYAKPKSGGGVPDLLDLLPKNASGQTRRIKDYQQPTGRIYTATDLVERLAESYRKAVAAQPQGAGRG